MSCLHRPLALLAFAFALAMAAPQAADAQARDNARQERPSQERPTEHRALSDAVRRVERATNGQVLSAESIQFDGRDVNRVKIIDDRGRVRVYWDDPQARPAERRDEARQRDDRTRNDRVRTAPVRGDDPSRRTRGNDGPAFNL